MSKGAYTGPLEQVDPCCYRIPKGYRPDMRVDGLIFANERLVESIKKDEAMPLCQFLFDPLKRYRLMPSLLHMFLDSLN